MTVRTAHQLVRASPLHVLDILTSPEACGRWTPIDFSSDQPAGTRLRAASQTTVQGVIAGKKVSFAIAVSRSDDRGLALTASGPVEMDIAYQLTPQPSGTSVHASIDLHRAGGLTGALLTRATELLLAGGALSFALRRIATEAEQLKADADPQILADTAHSSHSHAA